MDRNLRPLLAAALCVLALALAAATLTNPVDTGGGGRGAGGPPSAVGPGSEPDFGFGFGNLTGPSSTGGAVGGVCVQFLASTPFQALALLAAVAVVGLLWYWRDAVFAVAVTLPAFLVLFLLYALLTSCGAAPPDRRASGAPSFPNLSDVSLPGGSAPGAGEVASAVPLPTALLSALLVVVLVALVLLYRTTGDDEEESDEPAAAPPEEAANLEAVGAAAGAAAERIESAASVENEVYRAWREMTDHLDVARPEATTPAEFAAAAREAGMDPGHVDELTGLFREVRYGGAAPDAAREERALSALRAIEEAYGGDDA